jgi:DNA-binding transcriptional ArsR family regulator
MPGTPGESRPQVVVEPAANNKSVETGLLKAKSIDEVIWLGDRAVCLLRHSTARPPTPQTKRSKPDPSDIDQDQSAETTPSTVDHEMVLYGFGGLPVAPVAVRVVDGWIELHLVTTAYPKLRDTVSELREAAFDVDLRQVIQSDRASVSAFDTTPTVSVVDLSTLTDRQREVAVVALEMGYFEETGAAAEEIAAALQISKSTLSEHLRIVIRKLLSQLIP